MRKNWHLLLATCYLAPATCYLGVSPTPNLYLKMRSCRSGGVADKTASSAAVLPTSSSSPSCQPLTATTATAPNPSVQLHAILRRFVQSSEHHHLLSCIRWRLTKPTLRKLNNDNNNNNNNDNNNDNKQPMCFVCTPRHGFHNNSLWGKYGFAYQVQSI